MSKKQMWIALGLIVAVGALLRGIYLFELPKSPDFKQPLLDHLYHDLWARHIAFGESQMPAGVPDANFDSTPYFRPPGYPYFLAFIYKTVGTDPFIPRVFQMIIGLLTVVLCFQFARKWFSEMTALLFAGLMAVSWIFIYYEAKLHAPFLLVFLAVCLIYALSVLMDRFKFGPAILAGLTAGLFALVRPNILTFLPVAFLWIIWVGIRHGDKRKALPVALAFALTAAAVIAPAAIRNYRVAKDCVLISANGGINLFFGNNEYTRSGVAASHPELGAWSCFDYPRIVKDLETRTGETMTYGQVSSYYQQRALDFIRANPRRAAALFFRKTLLFWSPMEVSSYNDVTYERHESAVLRNLPLQFSLTLALALAGLGMCLSDIKQHRDPRTRALPETFRKRLDLLLLILLLIAVYSVTLTFFIISSRYRVPLMPFLLLGASFALWRMGQLFMERKTRPFIIWVCAAIALFMLANFNFAGYQARPDLWHQHRAMALERADDWGAAVEELQAAVAANPGNAEIHANLGIALARQGRIPDALLALREAVRLDPGLLSAQLELGKVFARTGRMDEAMTCFRRALEISPNHADSHVYYGSALVMMGRADEAVASFQKALSLRPSYADAHVCLGDVLARQGSPQLALTHFESALAIDPDNPAAHFYLARIHASRGDREKAKLHFREVLRIDPDSKEAQAGLGKLMLDDE